MRDKEHVSAFLSRQPKEEGLTSDLDETKKNNVRCKNSGQLVAGSRNNHFHLSLDTVFFTIRNSFLRFMGTFKSPDDPELTPFH